MLKYGGLSQVGLMAALLKSVGRLKRRGGSSPSSSAKTVEDLTELNKIKLNQLFKYINNYIFQAIRSKKHFYCFDNKKNIGCNLYKIGRGCSLVCIKSKEENFWYIRIIYRIRLDE